MISRKTYIPFGESVDHSIDYLLGILLDARVTTLQRITGITTEELHWQYAEGWNTIGALLSHIHACEEVFRIEYIEQRSMNEAEKKLYTPGLTMGTYIPVLITGEEVNAYINRLEDSRKKMEQAIKTVNVAEFFEKRTDYNLAWVLYHLAEDEVNHRGQISLLRKLYKMLHPIKESS